MDRLCSSQGIDPQVDFYLLGLKPNFQDFPSNFFTGGSLASPYKIARHQL